MNVKAKIRHCQHRMNSERCTSDTSLQENVSLLYIEYHGDYMPQTAPGCFHILSAHIALVTELIAAVSLTMYSPQSRSIPKVLSHNKRW